MKAHHWTLLLLLLICAVPLGAQQRCVTVAPAKQVQQPNNVAPGTTLISAYGGTYSSTDDLLMQILAEMKGLRADIAGLKQGQGGQQEGALGIIASKCLKCHGADSANEKGGETVLVEKDGTLAEFSLAEKRRITKMVTTNKMPPNQPLNEAEKKLISDYFDPAKQPEKEKK